MEGAPTRALAKWFLHVAATALKKAYPALERFRRSDGTEGREKRPDYVSVGNI
jgi:hypothetical protein